MSQMTSIDRRPSKQHEGGPTTNRPRTSRRCVAVAAIAAVLWALAAAYYAYTTLPHLPLDISAVDPATQKAFKAAFRQHAIAYAIIALLPLLVLLPVTALMCRRANHN